MLQSGALLKLGVGGAQSAYKDFVVKRRLWQFGLYPEHVGGFLAEYGWREVEQVGPDEYAARYLQSAGRSEPVSRSGEPCMPNAERLSE
jgi:O-methyltransferase involved in polyketide biosynthesis